MIDYDDTKEIARALLKLKEEADYETIDNALHEKWGIDDESLQEILNRVFDILDFSISPLTQTAYVGIAEDQTWLAKKEVNQQFIAALINWCTEGEEIPEGTKGFERTITSNGKPKYKITIEKIRS